MSEKNKLDLKKLVQNKHIRLLIIIFIIGITLMVAFQGQENDKSVQTDKEINDVVDDEKRLKNILSQIEGVGDVSVMITYYETVRKDIAYETKTNSMGNNDRSEESEDKKAVLSDGKPMIIKETYPRVKGVIVTASGADDVHVKSAISRAVTAVLDVSAHRVCIYKKED